MNNQEAIRTLEEVIKALKLNEDAYSAEILDLLYQDKVRTAIKMSMICLDSFSDNQDTSKPKRAGLPWPEYEDDLLLQQADSGVSISDISFKHQRTVGGIKARLERLGFDDDLDVGDIAEPIFTSVKFDKPEDEFSSQQVDSLISQIRAINPDNIQYSNLINEVEERIRNEKGFIDKYFGPQVSTETSIQLLRAGWKEAIDARNAFVNICSLITKRFHSDELRTELICKGSTLWKDEKKGDAFEWAPNYVANNIKSIVAGICRSVDQLENVNQYYWLSETLKLIDPDNHYPRASNYTVDYGDGEYGSVADIKRENASDMLWYSVQVFLCGLKEDFEEYGCYQEEEYQEEANKKIDFFNSLFDEIIELNELTEGNGKTFQLHSEAVDCSKNLANLTNESTFVIYARDGWQAGLSKNKDKVVEHFAERKNESDGDVGSEEHSYSGDFSKHQEEIIRSEERMEEMNYYAELQEETDEEGWPYPD